MIKHIAMFNLKDEAGGRTKAENLAQIRRNVIRLRDEIPVKKRIEVAEQLPRDRGVSWAADVIVLVEFDNLDDYDTYFGHPVHKELAAFAASVSERGVGITYESNLSLK